MRTVKIKARALAIDHAVKAAAKAGHKFAHVNRYGEFNNSTGETNYIFTTNNESKGHNSTTTHEAKPSL